MRRIPAWMAFGSALVLLGHAACDGDGTELPNPAAGGAGGAGAANTGGAGTGANNSGSGGGLTVSTGSGGSDGSGCDKVDFMFIVDNSVSMRDQQAALIASFPDFIATIQTTLTGVTDYNIMVVDTDEVTRCTPACCANPATCDTNPGAAQDLCVDAAGGYACNTMFDACDNTLGAGVVHPAGDGASNQVCAIQGGNRFMIEGEPDLAGTFACVAQVGLAGHPAERPMDALVAALAPDINAPGGCNEGFLRDDAILVVTFLSDDPNYEDAGLPADWYDAVVAAKGGNADAVAVLGLTPAFDGCGPDNRPDKGKHWSEFIALFGARGLEASICEQSYGMFFEQAVEVINDTCDDFTPPS